MAVIESARGNRNPADPCTSISVNLTPSGGQLTGSVWLASNERTQTNVYCVYAGGGEGLPSFSNVGRRGERSGRVIIASCNIRVEELELCADR